MTEATDESGDRPLRRLLTEVVGSGHTSADDVSRAQATLAFRRILDGEPAPTTLGAFRLANRWKRTAPEELAANVDVMAESVERAAPEVATGLEMTREALTTGAAAEHLDALTAF
jgi:anthranilate phosphoribosyltransferase